MLNYRAAVATVSGRQLAALENELARLQGRSFVGALPALPPALQSVAGATQTAGFQLDVPGVQGITGGALVNVPGHIIPGAADVLQVSGLSIDSIPTDVQGAIKTGIQVAGQIAGKLIGPAITSALSSIAPGVVSTVSSMASSLGLGGAFGSALPGIGNLVGLAVAGLVEAIKALVKLFKGRQQCDFDPKCPDLTAEIANLAPVDALPVIAKIIESTSRRLAHKAIAEDCYLHPQRGKGGKTWECMRYLLGGWQQVYEFAKDTPEVMGIPQIERLLPQYQSMPTQVFSAFYPAEKVEPFMVFTEQASRVRDWTTHEGVQAELQGRAIRVPGISIIGMVQRMQTRRAYLLDLGNRVSQAAAQGRVGAGHLRFNATTELRRATENYVYSQTPEMQQWLHTVGQWMAAIDQMDRKRDEVILQNIQTQKRRQAEIEALPPAERAAVKKAGRIGVLKMLCADADGKGKHCDELRVLQGLPAPAPAASALKKIAEARAQFAFKMLRHFAMERKDPAALALFRTYEKLPGMTRANMYIMAYEFIAAEAKGGDKVAQLILLTANKKFSAEALRGAA